MQLTLEQNEKDKSSRDRATYAAWGDHLSLAQYLGRESTLRTHPWAKEHMSTWFLREKDGTVLASCETFRMPMQIDTLTGHAYAIASVFVEPKNRGLGYASRMIDMLLRRVTETDAHALSSILFSDVGPNIYARLGYVLCPSFTFSIPPAMQPTDPDLQWITETDVSTLFSSQKVKLTGSIIAPSAMQIDWHLERERYYSLSLRYTRPRACGARMGNSFVLWVDPPSHSLMILLWSAESEQVAKILLQAAQTIAYEQHCTSVDMWQSGVLPAQRAWIEAEATLKERSTSLLMMHPLASGIDPLTWTWAPRALWV